MAHCYCIGSSSAGNSYLLRTSEETLILELGISWDGILKALDYDLSKVTVCLCSHVHHDHSKSVDKAIKSGLSVFSCADVAEHHKGVKVLRVGSKTRIGGFLIQPIPLKHSVEVYGYIVEHDEFGKLVFCTDCESFPFRIKNVNHWFIEANHSEDIIMDNILNNEASRSLSENHMSVDDCVSTLRENFCADTQSITLIHLSDGNADERAFVQRVKDELCFDNVYAANKGTTINLEKEEF